MYKDQRNIGRTLGRNMVPIGILLMSAIFTLFQPNFLNLTNIMDIIRSASLTGTIALGMMIPMIIGDYDLAAGSEATLAASVIGYVLAHSGANYVVTVLFAALLVCLLGFFNSLIPVRLGIPAFLGTLAVGKVYDAGINLLTGGKILYSSRWPAVFTWIGEGYVFGYIPALAIAFLFTFLCVWVLLDKTKFGVHLYAIGDNRVACRQVGINIVRVRTVAFMICGLICGFGGVLLVSYNGNVQYAMGERMLMNCITAALLGATMRDNRSNALGTVLAAIFMAVISNGISSLGLSNYIDDIIKGAVLVFAIGYSSLMTQRKQSKKLRAADKRKAVEA